jgi:phosphatidylserine decarboxylase|tara:strand:+ start:5664 stop:6302 length:639 start_codon:yes stop_codon:yes gene_type:complete
MKLHKEGKIILRNLFITSIILLLGSTLKLIPIFIFYIIFLLFIISLNFFRIPKRKFEKKEGIIYAPCDGKLVVIEETNENEYFKDRRLQVSIFMSPLNVHNNLYPISGVVKYLKYHHGKFLVAWNPKSSTDNERSTVVVKNEKIEILCRQIAGALARRIITYSKLNDEVNVSDELGFIKFGSRVDIYLPLGTKIKAKLDQKMVGGKSIIGTY